MPDYVETNFDERSGIVPCTVPWGRWWQTVAEVHIEVDVPEGTKSKLIQVDVKPSHIKVVLLDKVIFEGRLYAVVRADETVWTLEDKRMLHIAMTKADACSKETLWEGLLTDNFLADPWTILEMRKKLDLERFQIESGTAVYDQLPTRTKLSTRPNKYHLPELCCKLFRVSSHFLVFFVLYK
ncbi:nudC domain-containing protein 2 isoform X2 [Cherax quadricarinatus]|uniref:nudC domain-containing protein 2 isoform X2 n=1 Tax=Cherax quadricarinatus TaxID=27406 RepID=UPI0023796C8C|nr:nudC domain-containing protein 2-like isoform X2 [Cherax quadricarinatus]